MDIKYATCECDGCHVIISKNQAKQYSREVEFGSSSGTSSTYYGKKGYQGRRYTSGRTYYKTVKFWLCKDCSVIYEEHLADQARKKVVVFLCAAAAVVCIYFYNTLTNSHTATAPKSTSDVTERAFVKPQLAESHSPLDVSSGQSPIDTSKRSISTQAAPSMGSIPTDAFPPSDIDSDVSPLTLPSTVEQKELGTHASADEGQQPPTVSMPDLLQTAIDSSSDELSTKPQNLPGTSKQNFANTSELPTRNAVQGINPDNDIPLSLAIVESLRRGHDGERSTWKDQDAGLFGTVISAPAGYGPHGEVCRNFQYIVHDQAGHEAGRMGQGCRMANGNWLIR